uniref:PRA1 family protein n=1 Tax=Erythrolobus australicus TaxID=1077150 RepID=A0A7S1XHW7_9RHOD|mmetsp:Transcript_3778/g.10418  ORF Transcript_3778/g.10418 Transcript_3778/m.10418 type:complete len:246 (+) Transcript_3778:154-891(+)|eukprot:CAMPEP_0185833392 /NCGR_PEP_ID=MMETSP1353-20130828/2699_1 /TAXON_ID=1077150 /ORGANISM="Erythrolobus australicus, Strain CCMP3124" /LENGTH=245 /DNA_ID=CAMNT_0028531677 /DNA_START=132 /DNA_END=869 /DNA_ORIENTATION=+
MVVIGSSSHKQYARVPAEEPSASAAAESAGGERVVEIHHHHYHATGDAEPAAIVGRGVGEVEDSEPRIGVTEYLKSSALALKSQLQVVWNHARPWTEVLDTSRISFPLPDEWLTRSQRNFDYFKNNYAVVAAGFVGLGLLHNPIGLVLFGFAASAIGKKLAKIHAEDPTFESHRGLVVMWSILGFLAFLISGVGGAIVGAVSSSAVLCGIHSIIYRPQTPIEDVEACGMPAENPFASEQVSTGAL